MRQASVPFKVRYTHVPADGRTPVFNSSTGKWEYHVAPDAAIVAESVSRLEKMEEKAATALAKYESVDLKASQAQLTAESKATAEEAVAAAWPQMFRFVYNDSFQSAFYPKVVQFEEYMPGVWRISLVPPDGSSDSVGNVNTHGTLGYASSEDVDDIYWKLSLIEERLAAIENRMGIS